MNRPDFLPCVCHNHSMLNGMRMRCDRNIPIYIQNSAYVLWTKNVPKPHYFLLWNAKQNILKSPNNTGPTDLQ